MGLCLEITVEIGTAEQQTQIQEELAFFQSLATAPNSPLNKISKVIVPSDFDAAVNTLQGTTTYASVRDVLAVAKIVNIGEAIAIVLSPNLYTASHDNQTRCFFYLHELFHVSNKHKFPSVANTSPSDTIYLTNLYSLFDEYVADRLAYEVIDSMFQSKSSHWQGLIQYLSDGYASLINDAKYHDSIKTNAGRFRTHNNVDLFLTHTRPLFDSVAICIAHAFSLADHNSVAMQVSELKRSPFVNEKTLALVSFFRTKYEESSFDVHGGIDLVRDFMTNFGFEFEDTRQGLYCHVLDI